MPYSEDLANALRLVLSKYDGITEKAMFGGIAMLVHGNMCVGVWKDLLVVRLSKEEGAEVLRQKLSHVREMDITGKPMRGWLFVEPGGYRKSADLENWVKRAYTFASSLPKK